MKNRFFIAIFFLFIVNGCASKAYNVPFVDTKETLDLEAGMDKSHILGMMGEPLYVELGDDSNKSINWIYEVRSLDVLSEVSPSDGVIPNKYHKIQKSSDPLHHLRLVFTDDQLSRWEAFYPIDKKMESDIAEEKQSKGSDLLSKIYIEPKISYSSISYSFTELEQQIYESDSYCCGYESQCVEYESNCNSYDEFSGQCWDYSNECIEYEELCTSYCSDYNEMTVEKGIRTVKRDLWWIGLNAGFNFGTFRFGLEGLMTSDFEDGFSFMGTIEKEDISPLNIDLSLGIGASEWDYQYGMDNVYSEVFYQSYVKFGLGRDFSFGRFSMKPKLNFIVNDLDGECYENCKKVNTDWLGTNLEIGFKIK